MVASTQVHLMNENTDPIRPPRLPAQCPGCAAALQVVRLNCTECDTAVIGGFPLPPLARLVPEDQAFVLCFLQTGGNLKDMAKQYGVSYPTLRNRLDALVEELVSSAGAESPGDDLGKASNL